MSRASRSRSLAAVVLLLAVPLAGCLSVTPAHVPDAVLDAVDGWEQDDANSQDAPTGSAFSATRQQALAYHDEGDGEAYPGSLTVITIRTLVTPDVDTLVEQVRTAVRSSAEDRDIKVDGETANGARTLGNGADTVFFVYNGTVEKSSDFFTRDARVKILGEVTQCRAERTSVVIVGLAQVTDRSSVGGIRFPENGDMTTWHAIVADPSGTIDGARGSKGLAYNVACG